MNWPAALPVPARMVFAGLAVLACGVWVEQLQPVWVWPIFLILVLGIGFLHGALDTVLLARTAWPVPWALAYLLAVLALLYAFSLSAGVALLLLIGMSLWHFGQGAALLSDTNAASLRQMLLRATLRVAQGGASVMLPALLSGAQLQALLQAFLPVEAAWVWQVWQACAWLWAAVALGAVGMAWRLAGASHRVSGKSYSLRALIFEIACLALLNAALSPLLAFALYFGLFHSLMHIRSVWHLCGGHMSIQVGAATLLVLLLTGLLMLGLAWFFGATALHGLVQHWPSDVLLRSTVVALAALTLPHAVIVGHFSKQLVVH